MVEIFCKEKCVYVTCMEGRSLQLQHFVTVRGKAVTVSFLKFSEEVYASETLVKDRLFIAFCCGFVVVCDQLCACK